MAVKPGKQQVLFAKKRKAFLSKVRRSKALSAFPPLLLTLILGVAFWLVSVNFLFGTALVLAVFIFTKYVLEARRQYPDPWVPSYLRAGQETKRKRKDALTELQWLEEYAKTLPKEDREAELDAFITSIESEKNGLGILESTDIVHAEYCLELYDRVEERFTKSIDNQRPSSSSLLESVTGLADVDWLIQKAEKLIKDGSSIAIPTLLKIGVGNERWLLNYIDRTREDFRKLVDYPGYIDQLKDSALNRIGYEEARKLSSGSSAQVRESIQKSVEASLPLGARVFHDILKKDSGRYINAPRLLSSLSLGDIYLPPVRNPLGLLDIAVQAMAANIEQIGENQIREFVTQEFQTGSIAHSVLSDADKFNIYHRNCGDDLDQNKVISESITSWIVEKSRGDFDCALAAVSRLQTGQDSKEQCANSALGLASSSDDLMRLHQILSKFSVVWKERAETAIKNKVLNTQWNEFLELQSYYFDITSSEEISKRIASEIEKIDLRDIQFLTCSRLNAEFSCNVEATLLVDGDDLSIEEKRSFQCREIHSGTWDISERHLLDTSEAIQGAIEIVRSRPSDFFEDRIRGAGYYDYDYELVVLGDDEDEHLLDGFEILEIENEAYLLVNEERVIYAEYDDYYHEDVAIHANISGEPIAEAPELSYWGPSSGMPHLRYVFEITAGAKNGQFYLGENNKVLAVEFLKILLQKYLSP